MDYNLKLQVIDEIRKHVDVFVPVPPIRYRIRCPICGDSQKDLRDSHCYIKCSNDPNEPLLYKCFLANCGAKGKVDKEFLKRLGIDNDISDKIGNERYNRIGMIRKTDINIITGDPIMNSPQVRYIEKRLGKGFTEKDFDKFKIIWDIKSLVRYISDSRTRNTLPSNDDVITFLSDDKSSILVRSIKEDCGFRWKKINLVPSNNASFYVMKATLDIFTSEPIEVNIAEGIFDILSAYKNFNVCNNSVFIAILGGDYYTGVEYAIKKGILGSNVTVKIYIDENIDVKRIKGILKNYKWLFNRILILQNIKYEDIGTTIDKIELKEYRV